MRWSGEFAKQAGKAKKKRGNVEEQHQVALVDWSKLVSLPKLEYIEPSAKLFDYLLAVPNGGKRHPAEAAKLKAQGVKSGVSDLFLALPMNGYCGLWIEMKKPEDSKATENQVTWLTRMKLAGYKTAICYGWEQAQMVIKNYLDPINAA